MMVAALWANSGFEGQEGANARTEAISQLEAQCEEVSTKILSGQTAEEQDIDKENPFFAAAERGMEKIHGTRKDEGTVAEVVYEGLDIDQ